MSRPVHFVYPTQLTTACGRPIGWSMRTTVFVEDMQRADTPTCKRCRAEMGLDIDTPPPSERRTKPAEP